MAAGGSSSFELSIDQRSLIAVRKAMAAEADGKALRKDLIKDLRAAAAPGVPKLQAAVRSLPDVSPAEATPRLRETVAKQVKVAVALGGKNPGVKFRVDGKAKVRGFRLAGRRLNQPKGWRHPVFGNTDAPWVVQYGDANRRWFEPTIKRDSGDYSEAVREAIAAMARRIASKTTRGQR